MSLCGHRHLQPDAEGEDSEDAEFPCVGMTGIELEHIDRARRIRAGQRRVDVHRAAVVHPVPGHRRVPRRADRPGATWSADIVTENQGIEVPVTYHYTLTEVSDGRFTIQTTLDSDFDVEQDGIVGTGNMSGSGTSSGAVDNPLDAAASFTMALDMVSDIDGEDMTMTFNVDIEVVSVVPAS